MRYRIWGLLGDTILDLGLYIKGPLEFDILKRMLFLFLGSHRYRFPDLEEDGTVCKAVF